MEQMTTFNEYRVSNVLNKDDTVNYYGKILPSEEANQYFGLLMQKIQWEKDKVIIFGKNILPQKEKLHDMVILYTCILIHVYNKVSISMDKGTFRT
jgi:hypothetical protein